MHWLLTFVVSVPLLSETLQTDLLVYGSTPAGMAAAVVAARQGQKVVLIEPTKHVGGLLTGGLSFTDFRTLESVTGFFREYMSRVEEYYAQKYGTDSRQYREAFFGAHAEPHVSGLILDRLMAAEKSLRVIPEAGLLAVTNAGRRLSVARFSKGLEVRARFFIDATYEGDLAAMAGVPFRLGREARAEHKEIHAGVIYFDQGRILPGSTGLGDDSVQCANVRVLLTKNPANRIAIPRPSTYRREDFVHLLPYFSSGRIREVYSEDHSGILRLQAITNDKADMNDIKAAPVRLALPGEMQGWPAGDAATRQRIYQRHLDYAMSLLWFLQNDEAVPAAIRDKASLWGLPKDEFAASNHMPPVLYVREARRIRGRYTFTEHDTQPVAGSVRAPLHKDSIAIGDYTLNSHGHHPQGPLYPRLVEGDYNGLTVPFQIPFGVIQPQSHDNLFVPVALSASHVGYSALRLEPTWTSLGHAAGLAASLILRQGQLSLPELQSMLHRQGQATIYLSDVPPQHPLFEAAQWAGTRGLFQHLEDPRKADLSALKKRYSLQYFYAFPAHQLNPMAALEPGLLGEWRKMLPCAATAGGATRGEFLAAAYKACAPSKKAAPSGAALR